MSTKSVGSGGQSVTVSPDGTLLYLTLHDLNITQVFHILRGAAGGGGSGIAPGEPTSLGPPETIDVGDGPAGLAIMPDGSAALVANEVSGTVSLLHATPVVTEVPAAPRAPEIGLAPCYGPWQGVVSWHSFC